MILSNEQQIILDNIKQNKNVIVDACAGSGKSTTILSVALALPELKFLLITYNHSLRKEMQEKVNEMNIKNIMVHTYHSLAYSIYNKDACRDKGIRQVILNDQSPITVIKNYDILVLDEAQDISMLYFRFILKYIKDSGKPFQLMVLGDYMQGLYDFKGADIRFLTKASEIWCILPLLKTCEFSSCFLKTSYRITNQMADFVNKIMLKQERMLSCREGSPVCYIRGRIERLQNKVVKEIKNILNNGGKPDEIFILGSSVKGSNSYVKKIENALVESKIPCYVPIMDGAEIDEKVIKGKIVFSTFHSSKGRQRPYVFIVGFDNSYFLYKQMDPEICPNTLYVGCTRASQKLYLLENHNESIDRPLKFLSCSHKEMNELPFVTFDGVMQDEFVDDHFRNGEKEIVTHYVTPTELTKFINEDVLDSIRELLEDIFIIETSDVIQENIDLPIILKTKIGTYEDISNLNGIVIPAMLFDSILAEYEDTSESILYGMIKYYMKNTRHNEHIFLKKCMKYMNPECSSVSDYLYMANVLEACQEKLYFKLNQISSEEYDWLTNDILIKCKKRLIDVLSEELEMGQPDMEEQIIHYSDDDSNILIDDCLSRYFPNKLFRFSARSDLITRNTLWELKCTSELSEEYLIQTVIYAWILKTIDPTNTKMVKIFNIKTGEIRRLETDKIILDKIMVLLLNGKYSKKENVCDDDFLHVCHKYIYETFSLCIT